MTTNYSTNAQTYHALIKKSLEKSLPKKDVEIPFYNIPNTHQTVFFNPALEVDPQTVDTAFYESLPLLTSDAVITAEGVKTQLIKRLAPGQVAALDWLTFTVHDTTFDNYNTKTQNEHERQTQLIKNLSDVLKSLIGFAVDHENKTGRNFYERSFMLEHNAGFVCIGGQNNTISITITGTGCTFGRLGWEGHLNAWLNMYAPSAKITRVDLAHDDFIGEYDIDFFDSQDNLGGFCSPGSGRRPNVENRGNWKRPNNKGRSLYIGSPSSAKLTRIYEKGKQLGDSESPWVRSEVQFRSSGFVIDFDVLNNPSNYFLASYPCFGVFNPDALPQRFEVIEREQLITFEQALEITKTQFGRYIHFFRSVFGDDKQTLDILTDIKDKTPPERINMLTIPQLPQHN